MIIDIQERLAAYLAAVNGGDADTAAEAFAEDGKMLAPGAPPAVGRDSIREAIKGLQPMSPRLQLTPTDVLVEGDVAIETGTWSITLQTPAGPVEDQGNDVRVWRRGGDGVWRLYVDIWNSDRSPASG